MKINPVGYGKSDNIHFTSRSQGRVFRMVGFFETGDVWILKNTVKSVPRNFNSDVLFKELKESLEELDFNLITPKNKFLKHNFKTTQNLLSTLKQS